MSEGLVIPENELVNNAEVGTEEEIIATAARAEQFSVLTTGGRETAAELTWLDVTFIPSDNPAGDWVVKILPISETPRREFELYREAAVVNQTGANLIAVSTPGTGRHKITADELEIGTREKVNGPGNLSDEQRNGLREAQSPKYRTLPEDNEYFENSTFNLIGQQLGQGISEAVEILMARPDNSLLNPRVTDSKIILDCYSLGNSTGAATLDRLADEGLTPDVVLWREAPDLQRTVRPREILSKFIFKGGDKLAYYADLNRQHIPEVRDPLVAGVGRLALNSVNNVFYYPSGIAGSSMQRDLAMGHRTSSRAIETAHVVIRGEHSEVSPLDSNLALVEFISSSKGLSAKTLLMQIGEGTHPMSNYFRLDSAMIDRALREAAKL